MSAKPGPIAKWKQISLSLNARGTLMFLTGLGLTIREALVSGPERPSLYVLYAGMMGLPFVWGERTKTKDEAETTEPHDREPLM